MSRPSLEQSFVRGSLETPVGMVPRISSSLTAQDRWGSIKARWGVGRMHYALAPGLYALGNPDSESPVLVTANYKMSFDRLREALPRMHVWILVLDTAGINVWCAAGKGTFGTEELVRRIEASGLEKVVSHRELILPQLAGPGIAAHRVRKLSGFKVIYGPIEAGHIPAYLEAGYSADPAMRKKSFGTRERTVLIPVELVEALKGILIIIPLFFFLAGFGGDEGYWTNVMNHGLLAAIALLGALLAGAVLTPLLLPWLPGRAFSLKGLWVALIMAMILVALRSGTLGHWSGRLEVAAWLLLIPAVATYLAMNFTGASTYTSLSGVRKEMRLAIPLQISAGVLGVLLWIGSRFAA